MVDEHNRDMRFPLRRDVRRDGRIMVVVLAVFLVGMLVGMWLLFGGAEWLTGLVNGTICGC